MLVNTDQRQRLASCRRATGTANTVYIIFRHVRQFIVDHVRQLFNIQTTRRNIRRHQHANIAGFKIGQRAGTCALRFITVDRRAANTVFIKLFRQMVRAMLGAGEDQHLLPVALANHLRQQFTFAFFIDKVHVLRHLL
ncbi:Uncharacterised protein [Salmonella enterica subsp. enterica serovar Bovismorbificans]|nr:Uncharacterised protein [Salmonella enterica subsp. enterica serovar Bovismorbificans]